MTFLAEPLQRPARPEIAPGLRSGLRLERAPAAPTGIEAQPDWVQEWCATPTIEGRLAAINSLAKRRLPSYYAAEVWLHLLGKAGDTVTPQQMESLLRQFIMLAPDHAKASVMFDLLMNLQKPGGTKAPDLVFLITSCERYLKQAHRVLGELKARGADAVIVTGDPSLPIAVEDGPVVKLPVADSYEALPTKVLEGLTYLRRKHGPQISVMKIDDDMQFNGNLDPVVLANTARTYDYAGEPIGDHCCDRCWHFGKTTLPTPIFTRRQQGWFARGAMYLLGPRAVEHLVREWVYYPGEFAGHVYEDRAIGDALRRAHIEVTPVSIERMGGIVDHAERFVAPIY